MSCCSPNRRPPETATATPVARGDRLVPGPDSGRHRIAQAAIPAGTFAMGDAHGDGYRADGELPVHDVTVGAFDADVTTVTVADFEAFVEATGHRTDAEVAGSSMVFTGYATDPGVPVPQTPWWLDVPDATWRTPHGPDSDVQGRGDHPVVHVSVRDAHAYGAWARRSLPTEAQWERAARGGLDGCRYPWGDEHPTIDDPRCAIFTGVFPDRPTASVGTVPATSFAPNGFGLYQCVGNVWEWCADAFSARYYGRSAAVDPTGPGRGAHRVLRGGSHLCHDSYCYRYRVAARSHTSPASSASNIGFRTVRVR